MRGNDEVWEDPKTGKRYDVSQGIGDGPWGLFERRPNGALRRVKTVEMVPDRQAAEKIAAEYARSHGWKEASR